MVLFQIIYFTTSRMLQIALALTSRNHYHFSLLDFHWKLQQDYFLPCLFMLEFFIFHGISLRCSIWEARRKIYRRTQTYFCLLSIRNCRCLLHGILAIIGAFTSIPIAFTAHVGGFVAGFLLTKVLKDIEHKKIGQSAGDRLKKMVDFGEYGEQCKNPEFRLLK